MIPLFDDAKQRETLDRIRRIVAEHRDESPLELWEKGLILEAVFARLIDQPCLNLSLLTGCTAKEAHEALAEMDRRMGMDREHTPLTGKDIVQ